MCDSMKKFKEEMEKLGLFRKITVAANLIPPPARYCPGSRDHPSQDGRKGSPDHVCQQA